MIRGLALVVLCLLPGAALADSDSDIDRIPQNIPPPVATRPSTIETNLYAQSDVTFRSARKGLIVPLAPPPNWEARLFLDARVNWRVSDTLNFSYSGRLNLRAERDLGFPNHENIRHDLREAYLTWQDGTGLFIELGRINLKNGVAEGFNPTDYFKTRAVVEPTSADPTVLREDRLGTLMALGQYIWQGGSLMVAIAPKFYDESPIHADSALPSFDPMLDRTNAHTRILVKASLNLPYDLSPEFLAYREAGGTRFGFDLTRAIGRSVVAYAEWSGGRRASLIHRALRFGIDTGTLAPPALSPIPQNGTRAFMNDMAIGASYSSKLGITFNLEYHYHQAGFSGADWRNWFAIGTANATDPAITGTLWFIRGYAADQEEPVNRNNLFLREDWRDAFVRDLHLTSFVLLDLHDGSGLGQMTADYDLSRDWTLGGLVDVNFGSRRSEFGSLPRETSILLKVSRYF